MNSKDAVLDFWNDVAFGEELFLPSFDVDGAGAQSTGCDRPKPYNIPFADFAASTGRDLLEIGSGPGAEHDCFAQTGAKLYSVDLTPHAVKIKRRRLQAVRLTSGIRVRVVRPIVFSFRRTVVMRYREAVLTFNLARAQ